MQIIHHLIIDMAGPLPQVPVHAVQGDGNTRALQIALLENGSPWEVPEGVTAAVAFRKPDKTKGLYDTLPDGTAAVTIEGSTVTAVLAPQVLSCAGEVRAAIVFHDASLDQLATFPFSIRAAADPAAGEAISNDYYRYSTMAQVNEAVAAVLASLEELDGRTAQKADEAAFAPQETLPWRQLAGRTGDAYIQTNAGITVTWSDTTVTATGTATAVSFPSIANITGVTGGHVHLLRLPGIPGVTYNIYEYGPDSNGWGATNYITYHAGKTGDYLFTTAADTDKIWIGGRIGSGTAVDGSGYLNLFDLTGLFGAGNEPTPAEFTVLFPKENYPYDLSGKAYVPNLSSIRALLRQETETNLTGKKLLVLGDSLSAANKWQAALTAMGASYTNHCLGGASILQLIDGGSGTNGTLAPLTAEDVADKDAIIFFGGQNNHAGTRGSVGDLYPQAATVAGYLQYAINKLYALLTEAGNLTCRVMVITPYCFGPSAYNQDAFQEDGVGLAQIIEDVAGYNGIPVWNAYKNSGINPTTLAVWGASETDHVHLNSAGYAHLGALIARFADREVVA